MVRPPQTSAMDHLVARLSRLPGIGNRSAQRLAFYLLKQPIEEATELAAAIGDLKKMTQHCSICFNLTEADTCPICANTQRDHSVILVVEQPSDVATFEATGTFQGVYHVLMGRLSPLDGIGPGELNIAALLDRVRSDRIHYSNQSKYDQTSLQTNGEPPETLDRPKEVILGMGPTLDGDGTAMYLAKELSALNMTVTRLARGLPTGSSLELVSKAVLADSIQGRQSMPTD